VVQNKPLLIRGLCVLVTSSASLLACSASTQVVAVGLSEVTRAEAAAPLPLVEWLCSSPVGRVALLLSRWSSGFAPLLISPKSCFAPYYAIEMFVLQKWILSVFEFRLSLGLH